MTQAHGRPRIDWRRSLLAGLVLACAGCATVKPGATPVTDNDPFESWNRKVFAFNQELDDFLLRPVAVVWAEAVPQPMRTGIGNFYANIADAWSAVNNLLQGKPRTAFAVAFRFSVNTVFGFGGLLDLASEMGIDRSYEDFGQTLGVWGFDSGPYLVWPLLGPSTLRDSVALPLNYAASPMYLFDLDWLGQFGVWTLNLVNTRSSLLGATSLLDTIALDKYSFVRGAYLQRRRSQIYDGEEPPSPDPSTEGEGDAPPAPAASAPAGQ
jgi:phospholipid-binding lipoprotein MlaA